MPLLQPNCPKCGGAKHRYPSGQYHCKPCQSAKSKRLHDSIKAAKPPAMWTCMCGNTIAQKSRPRDVGGHLKKHCGCVNSDPYASLPNSVSWRIAAAKGGNSLAQEWHKDWLRQKREARIRAAEKQGRVSLPRAQVALMALDNKHVAALCKVSKAKARANYQRSAHDAHIKARYCLSDRDEYRWLYQNNPEFCIKERLRNQLRKKAEAVPGVRELIRRALKQEGNSPRVEALLGYSIAQLKVHIERQFKDGMSWDRWGRNGIHIDHILPRKCFDITTVEGIQAYWSLSNLQPLWAKDNIRKAAKLEWVG